MMCVIIITIFIFIQKLNTTNECVVSVLGGISSTAHQVPTVNSINDTVLTGCAFYTVVWIS